MIDFPKSQQIMLKIFWKIMGNSCSLQEPLFFTKNQKYCKCTNCVMGYFQIVQTWVPHTAKILGLWARCDEVFILNTKKWHISFRCEHEKRPDKSGFAVYRHNKCLWYCPKRKKGIRGRDAIALRSIAVGIADTPPLMPSFAKWDCFPLIF